MAAMNHPFNNGKLPYEWERVPKYWPQRLLHASTLTSVERVGEDTYEFGGQKYKAPKYSTLSYTWGRWRVDGEEAARSPALPVKNITWAVPPIKDEHFTVDAFRHVINQMATLGGVEWVWVDVGCIDQRRDDPEKNFVNKQAPYEIGRQASIYKQAKATFVWLCRLRRDELSTAVNGVQTYSVDFSEYFYGPETKKTKAIPDDLVQNLVKSFDYVFSDPWFSSIWTLQEVVLRNDALVFPAEGEPVPWDKSDNKLSTYLTMFINTCQNVCKDLELALEPKNAGRVTPQAKAAMYGVRRQILQAGFYYLFSTNPNVLYGTARYRVASNNVDRIYGIMQIYGFQLGRAADPDSNPTLAELVREMAEAITKLSPILGQYFVHTATTLPEATWQITEKSYVPDPLMIYRDPKDLATITFEKEAGLVVAAGSACPFLDLLQAAEKDAIRNPAAAVRGLGLDFDLFFDSYVRVDKASAARHQFKPAVPEDVRSVDGGVPGPEVSYERIRVLHLGHLRGLPRRGSSTEFHRRHVGLLLYPAEKVSIKGDRGDGAFIRLGVCIWSDRWSDDWAKSTHWQSQSRMILV
ncbi:hypothetical protein VTH82DRAFT_3298 [Thermothelomyces myriococcoides]